MLTTDLIREGGTKTLTQQEITDKIIPGLLLIRHQQIKK
jgi:hypothetical protein